jgi:hypothetical protein
MPHQVVAGTQVLLDPLGMLVEIDPRDGLPGREPRPVQDDELEAICKRLLLAPSGGPVGDTPVDEDDALDDAILRPVTKFGHFRPRERKLAVTSR